MYERKDTKRYRGKDEVTYKGSPIRLTPDFSTQTLKVRKPRRDVLQTLRDHRCQARLLYPAKLSSTLDRESKAFHKRTKHKEYLPTTPGPQETLEGNFSLERLYIPKKTKVIPE